MIKMTETVASGFGSVGRAVASEIRDLQFEFQSLVNFIYFQQFRICIENMKIKKKRPGMARVYKNDQNV